MSDVTGPIDFGGGGGGGGAGGSLPVGAAANTYPVSDGAGGWIAGGPALTAAQSSTINPDVLTIAGSVLFNVDPTAAVWASRGSGTFTGQVKRITDIGPTGGTWFRWDGTVWRLMAPTFIVFDTTLQSAAALNTSEQIVKQNTIPTGLLSAGRLMALRVLYAKDGTTDAFNVTTRLGSAGTTADTSIAAFGSIAAVNRAYQTEAWYIIASTTQLRNASAAANVGFASTVSTTPTPVNYTIADHTANALILSCDTTMAGSTNHGQVAHVFLELFP